MSIKYTFISLEPRKSIPDSVNFIEISVSFVNEVKSNFFTNAPVSGFQTLNSRSRLTVTKVFSVASKH